MAERQTKVAAYFERYLHARYPLTHQREGDAINSIGVNSRRSDLQSGFYAGWIAAKSHTQINQRRRKSRRKAKS